MSYTLPELIRPDHIVEHFNCGEPSLDQWLKQRARDNEKGGASRTYVVCQGIEVVGYYRLSAGSISRSSVSGAIARNMPDPIPVMVLGRLAVDRNHARRGIGSGLIKDAVCRTWQASQIVGIRAILVHALNDNAMRFCVDKWGFK